MGSFHTICTFFGLQSSVAARDSIPFPKRGLLHIAQTPTRDLPPTFRTIQTIKGVFAGPPSRDNSGCLKKNTLRGSTQTRGVVAGSGYHINGHGTPCTFPYGCNLLASTSLARRPEWYFQTAASPTLNIIGKILHERFTITTVTHRPNTFCNSPSCLAGES